MADFQKLSFIFLSLGYAMDLLMMSSVPDSHIFSRAGQAMFIIAFLSYTTAMILGLLIKFDDLKGNKPAVIATIVLAFVACVFIIIGLAIFGTTTVGGRGVGGFIGTLAHSTSVYTISLIFAFLAGLFLVLDMVGVGGGGGSKTGPS